MNNRSAAGLRRSAIAERIRLREEWSELKGTDEPQITTTKKNRQNLYKNILNKKQNHNVQNKHNNDISKAMQANSEVLHGIVALVEVGAESRALALRAALAALGATVVPAWSPLVTHLIWAQGGCRATRAKARALASRLVSPLWVEACASAARRLPEQAFPAAARASDLPSPRTLRQLLKKAEMENIPLLDLLSDKEDRENRPARLRLSSETDHDTSADTSRDTSKDTSRDTSKDTSHDKTGDTTTDIESRVNTAPRRALPNSSVHSPRPTKSRRKLFTQREAELRKSGDESDAETPSKAVITQKDRKQLARAERLAKKLVAACRTPIDNRVHLTTVKPRIVLTGMDRAERHTISEAIRKLNGRLQSHVNRKTTHVLLGSCTRSESPERNCSGITALNVTNRTVTTDPNTSSSTRTSPRNANKNPNTSSNTRTSPRNVNKNCRLKIVLNSSKAVNNVENEMRVLFNGSKSANNLVNEMRVVHKSELQKARTLNALLGAARGCRVLKAQWALDSLKNNGWLHHHGYEVPHLMKISQKARIERAALGKLRSEYAYDVFYGMRVRVTPNAEQKDAAIQLLILCGAIVQNGGEIVQQNGGRTQQNVGLTQNGARTQQNGGLKQNGERIQQNVGLTQNGRSFAMQNPDFDVTVGVRNGEVCSKWVFDSVAAARMRTTRRYVNNEHSIQNTQASVI